MKGVGTSRIIKCELAVVQDGNWLGKIVDTRGIPYSCVTDINKEVIAIDSSVWLNGDYCSDVCELDISVS